MPSTASSRATSAFSRSDGRRDLLLSSRILCGLLALSLARGALAWGPEAHRMVGDIASRHLDPKASARVLELLKDDRLADGQLSGRRTLGEVPSWADENPGIRSEKAGTAPAFRRYPAVRNAGLLQVLQERTVRFGADRPAAQGSRRQ